MAVLTLPGTEFLGITLVRFILFYPYLNFILTICPFIELSFRPLTYRHLDKHTSLPFATHAHVLQRLG